MRLIDTHCHLDVEEFAADRDAVVARARAAGVSDFVIPGIYREEWPQLIAFCRSGPGLHPALGLHPVYLARHTEADLAALPVWVAREQPLAIGEIGLDFQLRELDRVRQQQVLERQLAVAREFRLPVLLHVRKAHDEMLRTLRRAKLDGGICHAFNGSQQQAEQYIDLGFKLGFGGMLTYERSNRLRALARVLPLSALVLETDAPDLTVASHRFERNSPEYLPEILQALAGVREADPAVVAAATSANAREVLGLPAD